MFCPNCGADLPEGAAFCGNCSTALGGVAPASPPPETQPAAQAEFQPAAQPAAETLGDQLKDKGGAALSKLKGAGSKKLLILVGAAAVALLALIILICALAGSGAKGTAKKWLKAYYSFDYSKAMKYEYVDAEKWLDENGEDFEDKYDISSARKFVNDYQQDVTDYAEDNLGKRIKVTKLDIRDTNTLSNKDRDAMIDDTLAAEADTLKFDPDDVKKIVEVSFRVEVAGKDDDETTKLEVALAKVGGKWYVLQSSLDMAYGIAFLHAFD